MKNKLLILIIFITQSILAQQVTLLQPALRDSDMKLDSIEFYRVNENGIETLQHRILFTLYDNEKNPTSMIVNDLNLFGEIINTHNEIAEYFSVNEYYIDQSFGYLWLPFENKTTLKNNTITNEEILNFRTEYLNDERYGFYNDENTIAFTERSFDENFNINFEIKNEVTLLNNLPIDKLFYQWNNEMDISEINYKEIYYNTFESEKLIERITKRIDDFNTNIEFNSKKETFNLTNTFYEYIIATWDDINDEWLFQNKETVTSNLDNKPVTSKKYFYNTNTLDWVLLNQFDFFYNDSGLLIEKTNTFPQSFDQSIITYNSDNLLFEVRENYYDNGNFLESYFNRFFYSPENTNGITDIEKTIIDIYPNPATTVLNINSEEIVNYKIYTIQGELIKKDFAFKSIDIKFLEKGIYFINFEANNLNTTNKFIVE